MQGKRRRKEIDNAQSKSRSKNVSGNEYPGSDQESEQEENGIRLDGLLDTDLESSRYESESEGGEEDKWENRKEGRNGIEVKAEFSEQYSLNGDTNVHPSRRSRSLQARDTRTLFVRSLPFTTTTERLTNHFSFIAPVKHAHVVLDPQTKESRGFGFVTFADEEDARKALSTTNDKELDGRKIKVEYADVRHRNEDNGAMKSEVKKAKIEEVKKRSPRLIIRNLPWSIKKREELERIFCNFGKVKDIIIPKSKKGGELMSGFAFVTMTKHRHAEKAIEGVNGTEVSGRTVAVDWAVEKTEWEKITKSEENDEEAFNTEAKSEDDGEGEASKDKNSSKGDEREASDESIDTTLDQTNSDSEGSNTEISNNSDENGEDDDYNHSLEIPDVKDKAKLSHDNSLTLFLRNLPFTTSDESLHSHFSAHFGPVRYARIVLDPLTSRPKGTGFIAFYNEHHYLTCLQNAPKPPPSGTKPSILLEEDTSTLDPTGKYTLDGRLLWINKVLDKDEAQKLSNPVITSTHKDKRRMYLLAEGTIPSTSSLYKSLTPTERAIRQDSYKRRQTLLQQNPSLHLSLTRLSIRNIPRYITPKHLKSLARKAVVGFASDVKNELRAPLSKEELARGGEEDREKERLRKKRGKGIVKQTKIMFEKANGRSRGYGFVEYYSHRWALMGLRWLNGKEIGTVLEDEDGSFDGKNKEERMERKKRMIVEFAIENAVVVKRRREQEKKSREIADNRKRFESEGENSKDRLMHGTPENGDKGKKRKLDVSESSNIKSKRKKDNKKSLNETRRKSDREGENHHDYEKKGVEKKEEKLRKVSRIIARKRMLRREKRKKSVKAK